MAAVLLATASPAVAAEPSATSTTEKTTVTRYDGPPQDGGKPVSTAALTEPTKTGSTALAADKAAEAATLPAGQSVYSDGTDHGPSQATVDALTSGPRPTVSATYGPTISAVDCQDDSRAYGSSGHVIDHFDYCAASYFIATFQVCTTYWWGTSCETTGTAQWRQVVVGRGYNNSDKVTRYVDFVDLLDEWKLSGDAATHSMTISMSCLTQVGSGCIADSLNGETQTIGQWAAPPSTTYFRFDSPSAGGFGYEEIGQYDFQTTVSLTGGTSASFGSNTFRCDSAPYIVSTQAGSGCVFPDVTSVFSVSVNSGATQEALHVYQAQYYPETTTPTDPNKQIPGSVDSGMPLSRTVDTTLQQKNTDTAVATCYQYYGPNYSAGGALDCDEYPFKSTHEGAFNAGTNYSARPIAYSDNRSGGAQLGNFYSFNRMLDGDARDYFFVQITG